MSYPVAGPQTWLYGTGTRSVPINPYRPTELEDSVPGGQIDGSRRQVHPATPTPNHVWRERMHPMCQRPLACLTGHA
jgi:hypothetical protein